MNKYFSHKLEAIQAELSLENQTDELTEILNSGPTNWITNLLKPFFI